MNEPSAASSWKIRALGRDFDRSRIVGRIIREKPGFDREGTPR